MKTTSTPRPKDRIPRSRLSTRTRCIAVQWWGTSSNHRRQTKQRRAGPERDRPFSLVATRPLRFGLDALDVGLDHFPHREDQRTDQAERRHRRDGDKSGQQSVFDQILPRFELQQTLDVVPVSYTHQTLPTSDLV